MTPGIFSIGFVVAPLVAVSALISTSATITSRSVQYRLAWAIGPGGMWVAAPMKNNIGIENTTLVRDARNARRAAPAAAGFAWPPPAVAVALAITICCFGQITPH